MRPSPDDVETGREATVAENERKNLATKDSRRKTTIHRSHC